MINIEGLFWYFFLIDSLIYNGIAWFYREWYENRYPEISNILPMNRIYGILYIGLMTWIGNNLIRLGILLDPI